MTSQQTPYSDMAHLFDQWLPYQFYSEEIPGAAIGVVEDGALAYEGYFGYADTDTKTPVTIDTQFRVASITKLMTAVAILQLAENDQLQLDDQVSHYLSWFNSTNDPTVECITIRQLLYHGSGMRRDSANYWNDDHFPSPDTLQAFFQEQPTVYETAEQFKYSNIGFGLLGMLIEAVSRQPYAEYIYTHILHPLQMDNTTVDSNKAHNLATGYGRKFPGQDRPTLPHIETKGLQAAAGLITTVRDICGFLSALSDDNTLLLTLESKREMRRIQWYVNEEIQYGLGVEIREHAGTSMYGHTGGFPGFSSYVAFDPEDQYAVIVFTNVIIAPTVPLAEGICRIARECLSKYSQYATAADATQLRRYTGTYTMRWEEIQIACLNGTLLSYDPIASDPLYTCGVLQQTDDNGFTLTRASGFGTLGEPVVFDGHGTAVTAMYMGAFHYKKAQLVPDSYRNATETSSA